MFGKIKKFVSEVIVELKKVSWSSRQELIEAAWVVVVSSTLLGIFIAGVDMILARCLKVIIG